MTYDFDDSSDYFPSNVITLVIARAKMLYPNTGIFPRPLRHTDDTQSIGIFGTDRIPDDSSYETTILGPDLPAGYPTVQKYIVNVQSFVKDMESERGIKTHTAMEKAMWLLLCFDRPLTLGLNSLTSTFGGVTERIQKRNTGRTKYISNEIDGTFLYLSTLQYTIETETH